MRTVSASGRGLLWVNARFGAADGLRHIAYLPSVPRNRRGPLLLLVLPIRRPAQRFVVLPDYARIRCCQESQQWT